MHKTRESLILNSTKIYKYLKPILNQFKSYYKLNLELNNIFLGLAIVCFVMWQFFDSTSDFGLNAFTETLGIVITVLFVERILDKKEKQKTLPVKAAAYEDVRLLSTLMLSYWYNIYCSSVPGPTPKTIEELLSKESFEKMGRCLDLDTKPNVSPPRSWWDWLPEQAAEFTELAEKILERHVQHLDPNAYSAIHSFLTDGMLNKNIGVNLIKIIRHSDMHEQTPRPRNLGTYMAGSTIENIQQLMFLHSWCLDEYEYLFSQGNKNIKKPFEIAESRDNSNPKCYMTEEKLIHQLTIFDNYRQSITTRSRGTA